MSAAVYDLATRRRFEVADPDGEDPTVSYDEEITEFLSGLTADQMNIFWRGVGYAARKFDGPAPDSAGLAEAERILSAHRRQHLSTVS